MDYSFADFPRELAKKIINDVDTRLYYTLKEMENLIDIFEWVERMKEEYPSFCFYPEDFDVDVLFRVCKNINGEINHNQVTCDMKIVEFGSINKAVINTLKGTRKATCYHVIDKNKSLINIKDLFYSESYFSNEEDRNKWIVNNTEED